MSERSALVVAVVRDLLFSTRIGDSARRLGYRFRPARGAAELAPLLAEGPALVLIDLTGAESTAALDVLAAAGSAVPVLGWTTHVAARTTQPLHARCNRVVTQETLSAELPGILRGYVEARLDRAER